jgi:CubicO group peptidase (beta-lactamase class C family)
MQPKPSTSFILSSISAALIFIAGACKDNQDLCDPTPVFNAQVFLDHLVEDFEDPYGKVAGYQIAVNQNGNLFKTAAGGEAVFEKDPNGPIEMTAETPIIVASVSKFIGTIAMMQVLDKHGISPNELIYDYLPERWKWAVNQSHYLESSPYRITFDSMLSMATSLSFGDDPSNANPGIMPTTDEMFEALQKAPSPQRHRTYQNGNFTLIRVLITELEYGSFADRSEFNQITTESYLDYIKRNIFEKIGIYDAKLSVSEIENYHKTNTYPRAYRYPFYGVLTDQDGEYGWRYDVDPTRNMGSGGLVLNCVQLAKILAYFKHSESLVSKQTREHILNMDLGLTETGFGKHGKYPAKGGRRGNDGFDRSVRSYVMMFPNGVEVALVVNSSHTSLGTTIRKAYDDAWVSPCD